MNYFDDEARVIEHFQTVKTENVYLMSNTVETEDIFLSIFEKERWDKWIDTSGKKDPPPDFYNPECKLMMDVMRVDDHTFENSKGKFINPVNQEESKIQKELSCISEQLGKPIFVVANSDLPTIEDHDYSKYYASFKRTIANHIDKIELYKQNHPGYKTIFFIMDESSGYVIVNSKEEANKTYVQGQSIKCSPYIHFLDSRFVSCFKDSEIDYLVWYSPFKHIQSNMPELPIVGVYDVKNINEKELILYSEELILGAEV